MIIIDVSRVYDRVNKDEQDTSRRQKSQNSQRKSHSVLRGLEAVLKPKFEQVVILSQELAEGRHLRASLFLDEALSPHILN